MLSFLVRQKVNYGNEIIIYSIIYYKSQIICAKIIKKY